MERFELDDALKDEIRRGVAGPGFIRLVQSVRREGKNFRISIRPVVIGGRRMFQAESSDEGRVTAKNFDADAIAEGVEEIIAQRGARNLHLMTAKGDLHVRVTRKGRVSASRSAPMNREAAPVAHDRVKNVPLGAFDSSALLRVTGIAAGDGQIRASMRGEYDQVNEFLRIVRETVGPCPESARERKFAAVDCGCGKAYLTLALAAYLREALGYANVSVVGVDRRADVIASARKMADDLGVADAVTFVESDLAAYSPGPDAKVDLVTSLHARDTATDEALAKGVEWKARYVLSAPCCQHELQKTLDDKGAFAGVMRQSILRERLCDLLTDAFRAMIMRIMGFRTQVVEFVSSEATARNIMIRCEYGVKPGQSGPVGEYLDLRDYWNVTPWLETRLGDRLRRMLGRFE